MYEIVVRFRQREEVIERIDRLETAVERVQVYQRQGVTVYFRPSVRRAACIQPYNLADLSAERGRVV